MHQLTKHLQSEFHQSRNLIFVVFVFCMALVASFFTAGNLRTSSAASTAGFRAGNIISDAVMGNYNAMSLAEIQSFLDSKNRCDNTNYNEYLELSNRYSNITWHWEGEPYNGHFVCLAQEKFGDTNGEIGYGMTAAEIIYAAAQENRINPQVLLVLLQKESSLITDKIPNSLDYSKATGYGCPDTAACDKQYSGFKNQVFRAAELFRYTLDNGSMTYREGRESYIGYNPSSSCGGSQVYIENRATAALYRYTPYQPNTAALNAGYGIGDGCSAYGNRNFYLYFTDWFGSTQAAVDGELANIQDGEYVLASKAYPERVLGVSDDNAVLAALSETNDQRWQIKREAGTNYYIITNIATSQNLALDTMKAENGSNLSIHNPDNGICSQRWKIYQLKDNSLAIESACYAGMVVDINGGYSTIGTNIQLWLSHGGPAQKWVLKTGRIIADGAYSIVAKSDPTQALDINNFGSKVNSWESNGGENQRWFAKYDPQTDYYTFTNQYTRKALDLNGGVAKTGAKIGVWEQNASCAQKWKLLPVGSGSYKLLSACSEDYAVSLDGTAKNGTSIIIERDQGQDYQEWNFVVSDNTIKDGTYIISPKNNADSAIEIYNDGKYNGANVDLWSTHGGANQQWYVSYDIDTTTYTLTNPVSGKNLDVYGAKSDRGTNVQLWEVNSTCAQRWNIYSMGDGKYQIVSDCDNSVALDLNGGNTRNGTNIQIWDKNTTNAQRWSFQQVDD